MDSNEGLLRLATDVNYWAHWKKHSSYNHVPVDASGDSAMEYIRKFLMAATQDTAQKPDDSESASASETSESETTESATETSTEQDTPRASQTVTAG